MNSPESPLPSRRSLLFDRWPRFAAHHPWMVLAAALALIIALGIASTTAGGEFVDRFSVPGAESQQAFDLLNDRFPQQAGDTATVVVRSADGFDAPETQAAVEELISEFSGLPSVVSVSSPYEVPGSISDGGTIARFEVRYDLPAFEIEEGVVDALFELREERSTDGFRIELTGPVAFVGEQEEPGQSEIIGLIAAAIILLIAFGSVVAMGLPIITALGGLIPGFMIIGIASRFVGMASFTPQFASMIGIGVGIDYALLIVTRFREAKGTGLPIDDAIVTAMRTAGRAVLFAGSIVVLALLGLWSSGIPFVGWIASAAAVIVAILVIVALILLPAILALLGRHIDRFSVPLLTRRRTSEEGGGAGYRWSRLIQRHPVIFLILSLAVLLTLSSPILGMRLGSADASSNSETATTRRAYDLLSEGFGPGFNGPILIAMDVRSEAAAATVRGLPARLSQEEGIAFASPPTFNPAGDTAIMTVIPESAPQDEATSKLVEHIRELLASEVASADLALFAGGQTAAFIDVAAKMAAGLPIFVAAVIGLSVLLLAVVFRSILVPIKAALMILLSLGVGFGVVTAVFQWGWLGGLLGVSSTGPVESFLPMMLFAIIFGLSMDYEVFLLTRVQEEYLGSRQASDAVQRGQAITFRVIIAAALIMSSVFLSFTLVDTRVIKEFGYGLGVAILADALLVRMVLVPSLMHLFGNAAWWFPAWLGQRLPNISVDAGPAKPELP